MSNGNYNPLVSVVMPTYNHAQFIGEAINSVLAQTYNNFELIIVDNYSNDVTEEIVASFARKDTRINYTKFHNQGVIAASRNLGISKAKGELVAFIDSDDLWQPQKLAVQVERFKRAPQLDLLYCRNIKVLKNSKEKLQRFGSILTFNALLMHNHIACSSVLAKKETLTKAGLFDEDPYLVTVDDTELWSRLLFKGAMVQSIPEPLLIYRIHERSNLRWGYYRALTKSFYMCSKLFLKLDIGWRNQLWILFVLFLKALRATLMRLFL